MPTHTKYSIALVHDQLDEFGGAERVLLALSELFPDAPIYTAYYKEGSPAWERFRAKNIQSSWFQLLPLHTKLHSPLRFLAPLIWNSFDFRSFDLIIGSSSWYITKGFAQKAEPKRDGRTTHELCYCHTPPRWLYGYRTSVDFQRYWPVRVYGAIVGYFMRMYDFAAAQRVDQFVANSRNVAARIEKFYRRDSVVIYPPVDEYPVYTGTREDYYLVISRIVGGKGLELAVRTAVQHGLHLKIAGQPAGYSSEYDVIQELAQSSAAKESGARIEFLGYVSDAQLVELYGRARAFLALAQDEDFGITPVEAMMTGTPVIAYRGGGYLETVVEGKTGVFFDELSVDRLSRAITQFEQQEKQFDPAALHHHAMRFGKKRFQEQMAQLIDQARPLKTSTVGA